MRRQQGFMEYQMGYDSAIMQIGRVGETDRWIKLQKDG